MMEITLQGMRPQLRAEMCPAEMMSLMNSTSPPLPISRLKVDPAGHTPGGGPLLELKLLLGSFNVLSYVLSAHRYSSQHRVREACIFRFHSSYPLLTHMVSNACKLQCPCDLHLSPLPPLSFSHPYQHQNQQASSGSQV